MGVHDEDKKASCTFDRGAYPSSTLNLTVSDQFNPFAVRESEYPGLVGLHAVQLF